MRRALLFVLVAGLGLLAGCVTFHSSIVIEPDGSGTCTMNYSVSESVKEALAEAGSLGGEGKDMPSIEDFKREDMEKRAKENGVTITSFDHQTVDGRETLAIAMKFKDVTGLSRVMDVAGGDGGVMAILRNAEGNYVLTSIPDPNPPADEPEEPAEDDDRRDARGSGQGHGTHGQAHAVDQRAGRPDGNHGARRRAEQQRADGRGPHVGLGHQRRQHDGSPEHVHGTGDHLRQGGREDRRADPHRNSARRRAPVAGGSRGSSVRTATAIRWPSRSAGGV